VSELAARHAPDEADDYEPEDEEHDAGCEDLVARFGAALSLDALASGNVLNYSAVLKQDADTALLKLTMLSAQAAYQRRLQKLYHPKTD
jgi:hypothetical protein